MEAQKRATKSVPVSCLVRAMLKRGKQSFKLPIKDPWDLVEVPRQKRRAGRLVSPSRRPPRVLPESARSGSLRASPTRLGAQALERAARVRGSLGALLC